VHNERMIETLVGKPVLAWTVHEGHSWFYAAPQVRRALQQRRIGEATKLKKPSGRARVRWRVNGNPGPGSCERATTTSKRMTCRRSGSGS
jgi:hypothetical protein